ncbi:hypothetical protein SCLCIDRAFT_1221705 [Scleroderma citrinum Foug A]|uniref:Uncharacterized protein n=1 Tax=Scleroderma citrinum Foug A TaxID=1036808 RepID=A0A0C3DEH5_9AGAM|nr:hypothetical protein SCLCIDRAFT_1221705 [Scleroderma citrinum Foug A]
MTLAQFSAAVPVPSVVGAYRAKAGATLDRIYGRNIVRLRLSLICVIDQAIGESSISYMPFSHQLQLLRGLGDFISGKSNVALS